MGGDLRFFKDLTLELIDKQRELDSLISRGEKYLEDCEIMRQTHLPRTDRPSPSFYQATEGLNACRIIFQRKIETRFKNK